MSNGKVLDIYLLQSEFYNWEFRYPLMLLESTRSKIYVANFLYKIHIGYSIRELSFAGSLFDYRFDVLVKSR